MIEHPNHISDFFLLSYAGKARIFFCHFNKYVNEESNCFVESSMSGKKLFADCN